MATTTPLDAVLGAEIRGVDISAGVGDPLMRTFTDALYAHRVIVIKEQRLDEGRYLRFGRQWGTPIPHVLDHMRMPGYPELMTVGNTEKRDEESKIRNGAALWHTDQSYEKVPASATMLYSIIAPERGGETQYCDMATAYDNLDAETRQRIDGLEVAHKYGRGKRRAGEPPVNPIINDEQDQRVPPVYPPARHAPPHHGPQGAVRARARGVCHQGNARRRGGGAPRPAQGSRTPGAAYLSSQVLGGRSRGMGYLADDALRDSHRHRHGRIGFAAAVAHQRTRPARGPRGGGLNPPCGVGGPTGAGCAARPANQASIGFLRPVPVERRAKRPTSA